MEGQRWVHGRASGRSGGRSPSLLVRSVLGVVLLGAVGGCGLFGQDPARCDQSVATVRQAIGFKDFASARTWREYTWKVCDERGVVATLDKEIVDAETAAAKEAEDAKNKAAKLAKDRINAAQKLWRAFDAATSENKNEQNLDATRKSAARLESGLLPTFAQQLRKYNEGEHQKRLAALKR
jgi:phytoene dehydrogenase-like protein